MKDRTPTLNKSFFFSFFFFFFLKGKQIPMKMKASREIELILLTR